MPFSEHLCMKKPKHFLLHTEIKIDLEGDLITPTSISKHVNDTILTQ